MLSREQRILPHKKQVLFAQNKPLEKLGSLVHLLLTVMKSLERNELIWIILYVRNCFLALTTVISRQSCTFICLHYSSQTFQKTYLQKKIKVGGKRNDKRVNVEQQDMKIFINADVFIEKTSIKYWIKLYLKENKLNNWIQVVNGKKSYSLKYFRLVD